MTDIEALRLERDQLASRVAELQACMMPMMVGSCTCCTKTPVRDYHQDTCRYKVVGDVLDRPLPASLPNHDADLLEKLANSMPQDYNEGPGFQDGVNHAKDILLSRVALIRSEVSG